MPPSVVAYTQKGEAQTGRGPRSTKRTPSTLGEARHQVRLWSPADEAGKTPSTATKTEPFQRYRPMELSGLRKRRSKLPWVAIRLRLAAAPKSTGGTIFFQIIPPFCEASNVPPCGKSQVIPPVEASCQMGTLDTPASSGVVPH